MCLYPFFYSSLCVPWCACRGQVTTWSSSHLCLLLGSNSGRQAHKMIDFTGWSHLASADVTWRRREQRLKKRCLSNIFSNPMTMRSDGSHEIFTGLQLSKLLPLTCPLCVGPTLAESFWHCLGSWRSPCACLAGWQSRC